MSYCHYWGRPEELPSDKFKLYTEEVCRLRKFLGMPFLGLIGGVKITGPNGWGKPIINSELICLNGSPSHESFRISRIFHDTKREKGEFGLFWDFISTAHKPYDELVTASLISFRYYFPETALYSDGSREDWSKGIALYENVTNTKVADLKKLAEPGCI